MTTRRSVWRAAAVAMTAAALVGSLTPQLAPPAQGGADKFIHVGAYGALAVIFCLAVPGRWRYALSGCAAFVLSGGIELVQGMVPGRQGSWGDLAANAIGMIMGLAAAKLIAAAKRSIQTVLF